MNSHTISPASVPDLAAHPDADVVLYDGHCVFCTGSVKQLERMDRRNRLVFVSIHDPVVAERYPDLTFEQLMQQMYVIPRNQPDHRYGGAEAVRYLSRRLPIFWPFAPMLHIPFSLPLWQRLYRWIARRRYLIANKDGAMCDGSTCELHFGEAKRK